MCHKLHIIVVFLLPSSPLLRCLLITDTHGQALPWYCTLSFFFLAHSYSPQHIHSLSSQLHRTHRCKPSRLPLSRADLPASQGPSFAIVHSFTTTLQLSVPQSSLPPHSVRGSPLTVPAIIIIISHTHTHPTPLVLAASELTPSPFQAEITTTTISPN